MIQFFRPAKEDWKKFLRQCDRAMAKCGFDSCKSRNEWSALTTAQNGEKMTIWEALNLDGFVSYCESEKGEFAFSLVIDFDFNGSVYAEFDEKPAAQLH